MVDYREGSISEQVKAIVDGVDVIFDPVGGAPAEDATFLLRYLTAHAALVQRAKLQAGETLLVLGATGGTGSAAVQLGKDQSVYGWLRWFFGVLLYAGVDGHEQGSWQYAG